ncbi:hypothetical protein MNBD_GAMMA22-1242 [hydrothermal vent metagenome]|uniref:Uncharacterized protein n=1 Tax=hydrothermal vent metagenome TaxID=652676 RepID=A0A3B1AA41_9ZZZZ
MKKMKNTESISQGIAHANTILNDYGKVLSIFDQSTYGIPVSKLPHDKIEIKNAIQILLLELGSEDAKLQEGLITGYAILAQFISDEKIEILVKANSIFNKDNVDKTSYEIAETASKIINAIKLDMEELMNEIQLYISKNQSNSNQSS